MKPLNVMRRLLIGLTLVLGLIACGFFGCGGGGSSSPPAVAVAPARYLKDQNGSPFPILGRTAWFITSLSVPDYKLFIDDTVNKGYNSIEFHVVNHDPRGNNPPFGGNGELPFSKRLDTTAWTTGSLVYTNINNEAPNFSQPNEAYWAYVDALLDYAKSKDVLCFLFPAYVGVQGGNEGWMAEMVANGTTSMQTYGAFIANRYKTRDNIVWMLGGDHGTGAGIDAFTPPQLAVEKALLAGMKSVGGQASVNFSAEWSTESIYTDQIDPMLLAAGMLQGAYSFDGHVNTQARNGYAHSPVMPTFLLEEPYDEEGPPPDGNGVNPAAVPPVRRYQWWGLLSGIGGYISGNGYVWPFNSSPPSDDWHNHLNTFGAMDMVQLNAFVRSIAWYNLVPSGMGGMRTLVVGNSVPDASDYVAAAATPDGTLLVAYAPPGHAGPITIDMAAVSGPARARWFNPFDGTYSNIGTGLPDTGTSDFFVPGTNGSGYNDWVLVLDKQ